MTKGFHRSWVISFSFFAAGISLYFCSTFLQEKTDSLKAQSTLLQRDLEGLKQVVEPEKHLTLMKKNHTKEAVQNTLKDQAKLHLINIENIRELPSNTLEITLKAELDTDVLNYIKGLIDTHPATLSIQEIGLFREQNHVLGKVILKEFSAQETAHE